MVLSVVRQAECRVRLAALGAAALLVEDSLRLHLVLIYLHWHIVKLSHGLYLEVVTPDLILAILLYILGNASVPVRIYKGQEVLPVEVHVVHALLANNLVMANVSVNLICNCSVQTVAVVVDSDDAQIGFSLYLLAPCLLLPLLFDFLKLLSLEGELRWVELAGKTVVQGICRGYRA